MSQQSPRDARLKASGAQGFSRRTVLATLLGVPVILAAGSPAGALGPTLRGGSDATDSQDAQNAGEVLASLRFGMFVHFNPSSVVGREIGWGHTTPTGRAKPRTTSTTIRR